MQHVTNHYDNARQQNQPQWNEDPASNKPMNGVTTKWNRNKQIRRMKKGKLGINEKMLGVEEIHLI